MSMPSLTPEAPVNQSVERAVRQLAATALAGLCIIKVAGPHTERRREATTCTCSSG